MSTRPLCPWLRKRLVFFAHFSSPKDNWRTRCDWNPTRFLENLWTLWQNEHLSRSQSEVWIESQYWILIFKGIKEFWVMHFIDGCLAAVSAGWFLFVRILFSRRLLMEHSRSFCLASNFLSSSLKYSPAQRCFYIVAPRHAGLISGSFIPQDQGDINNYFLLPIRDLYEMPSFN